MSYWSEEYQAILGNHIGLVFAKMGFSFDL